MMVSELCWYFRIYHIPDYQFMYLELTCVAALLLLKMSWGPQPYYILIAEIHYQIH